MLDLRQPVTELAKLFWSIGVATPVDYVQQISLLLAYHEMGDLPEGLQWRALAGVGGETALKRLRGQVWPEVLSHLDANLFEGVTLMVDKGEVLKQLMRKIDALPWQEGRDLLGDAFETLLAQVQEKGVYGQFRTPTHLVEFIVEGVAPQPGETVWDPAAGSGTFLLAAHRHCPQTRVMGSDIDRHMARLAALNAYTHGLPVDTVTHEDTLAWALDAMTLFGGHPQSFDVIVGNPPFGGKVPSRMVPILGKKSSKSEVQFLGAIAQRLAPGGRAGVIVPAGVLFNRHAQDLRKHLMDSCRVRIVQLPSGAFLPHTNVATVVLFLEKTGPAKNVWFYDVQADGFSLDQKRRPVEENDLPGALAWLKEEPIEGEKAWSASVDEIVCEHDCNLTPHRYRMIEEEPEEYDDPATILREILGNEAAATGHLYALAHMTGVEMPLEGCGATVESLLGGLANDPEDRQGVEDGLVGWLVDFVPEELLARALRVKQGLEPAFALDVGELHVSEITEEVAV